MTEGVDDDCRVLAMRLGGHVNPAEACATARMRLCSSRAGYEGLATAASITVPFAEELAEELLGPVALDVMTGHWRDCAEHSRDRPTWACRETEGVPGRICTHGPCSAPGTRDEFSEQLPAPTPVWVEVLAASRCDVPSSQRWMCSRSSGKHEDLDILQIASH